MNLNKEYRLKRGQPSTPSTPSTKQAGGEGRGKKNPANQAALPQIDSERFPIVAQLLAMGGVIVETGEGERELPFIACNVIDFF